MAILFRSFQNMRINGGKFEFEFRRRNDLHVAVRVHANGGWSDAADIRRAAPDWWARNHRSKIKDQSRRLTVRMPSFIKDQRSPFRGLLFVRNVRSGRERDMHRTGPELPSSFARSLPSDESAGEGIWILNSRRSQSASEKFLQKNVRFFVFSIVLFISDTIFFSSLGISEIVFQCRKILLHWLPYLICIQVYVTNSNHKYVSG